MIFFPSSDGVVNSSLEGSNESRTCVYPSSDELTLIPRDARARPAAASDSLATAIADDSGFMPLGVVSHLIHPDASKRSIFPGTRENEMKYIFPGLHRKNAPFDPTQSVPAAPI